MAEVARLYYVRELTQQQIARAARASRASRCSACSSRRAPKACPLRDRRAGAGARRALDNGSRSVSAVAAVVVERDVARAAAAAPPPPPRDDDVLGVAWGETLAAIAELLAPAGSGVPVVQICGAIDGLSPGPGPTEVAARFAARTGGSFHPLEAPAVADERALRRAVRPTTEIFDEVSLALVGIGARRDAAGHMLVHVFDDDGRIVSAEHAIALSVAQLRRTRVVAVAGGRSKQRAVLGALRTGLVDVLVTDAVCARHALA